MYMEQSIMSSYQQASEIVNLNDGWDYWEGESMYPEGARSKYSVLCSNTNAGFIKSDWRYLFKLSRSRYPWQFWMEIAAYRIGCVIGVEIPPSHAAIGFDGEVGSLTEWMFDSRDITQGLLLGGEFMMRRDPEYDRNKGMQPGHCHNLDDMLPFMRGKPADDFIRMFVLDTLIANTDRHHSNWGFLSRTVTTAGQSSFREMRPSLSFDNGTSLGHERLEEKLPDILADEEWFVRHATHAGARHHIRLHRDDTKGTPMLELVPELLRHFPDKLPIVRACATFRDGDIRDAVYPLCDFNMPVRLSENRAECICRMVCTRRDLLMEKIDA